MVVVSCYVDEFVAGAEPSAPLLFTQLDLELGDGLPVFMLVRGAFGPLKRTTT